MSSIVLNVTCVARGYVGYTRGHLHERVERHKLKSSLIHTALCIISSVTSAMLVMSDTPVAICSYASMDIEARPRQCANTMIIDTQAGFRMTFAIVLVY